MTTFIHDDNGPPEMEPWQHAVGIIAILVCVAILLLSSCCVCKQQPRSDYRDSVVIRQRIAHVTATINLPSEVKEVVTRDTASHLENTFSKSDAAIRSGYLYHSLETKPQTIHVPVSVPVSDTTAFYSEKPPPEIIEVEKPLTQWQSFFLVLGRLTFFAILIYLAVAAITKWILPKLPRP
ncbi:MAG: hypothetical protein II891_06725 [Bacteroidales bacterium]|nr:hypothetical protein [Bacteroidales bacterium]